MIYSAARRTQGRRKSKGFEQKVAMRRNHTHGLHGRSYMNFASDI